MREDSNNSGRFWNDTRMFLLGTRVSWVAIRWGTFCGHAKGFRLAEHLLVDCPIGKRPK
jgi:hypothetical protein